MSIDPVRGMNPGSDLPALASEARRRSPGINSDRSTDPEASSRPQERPPSLPEARTLQVSATFGENHIVIYRIVDKTTGKLVEQIPSEQFMNVSGPAGELSSAGRPKKAPELDVRS